MHTSELVSIIIPVLNQKDKVKICLDAIFHQIFPKSQLEIIVVDNGSDDGTWNVLQDYPVRCIRILHCKSPYACKNAGAKLATGAFIIFLDANLKPQKDWLIIGLTKLNDSPHSIIIGNTVSQFQSPNPSAFELVDSLYLSSVDLANENSGVPGGNIFMKMETWKIVGDFKEMRSLGDIEWSVRALNSGIKLIPEKDAIAFYTPKMQKAFTKKAIRMGKGRKFLILMKKKNSILLLFLFFFRQFLPPNPFKFNVTIQSRWRPEYKGRFFEMYFVGWYFKLCYLVGIFSSDSNPKSSEA